MQGTKKSTKLKCSFTIEIVVAYFILFPGFLRPKIINNLLRGHSNLVKAAGSKKKRLLVTTKKLLSLTENLKKT